MYTRLGSHNGQLQEGTHRVCCSSTPFRVSTRAPRHFSHKVVGFVSTSTDEDTAALQRRLPEPERRVQTMKERMLSTASFRQFQNAIYAKPSLADDWISFTSRPWVQGPVDAFFGNTYLAALMKDSKELEDTVDKIIQTGDQALQQGNHVPWLLHFVKQVASHSGIYIVIEALEEMLGPHRIARLETLTTAALTRPRAVKLVAVIAALLTPQVIEDIVTLLKTCFTDERINRMMDAAEYVVSDDDRMALADLALDQLNDAVTDDGILHMIASLDAVADVQLMLDTAQELLTWLLKDPAAMGASIGLLIDEVVDMKRLQRTVPRNDEVMTLERISIMHKVLAQMSPAMRPENISAASAMARDALVSNQVQRWAGEAAHSITLQDVRTWWTSFDQALTPAVLVSLLHLVESLLDGGRIWALFGQPQPMLEMLLVADEEARAATCRSSCGVRSRDASPTASLDLSSSSGAARDGWSLSSMDNTSSSSGINPNRTLAEAAAAAAAAAAEAAAAAAAVAPSCEIGDKECRQCSGSCGSPVERMFAAGAGLSDPNLQELIGHYLGVCRQPHKAQQRRVATQAALLAAAGADATASAADDAVPIGSFASMSSHLWDLDDIRLDTMYGEDTAIRDAATASAAAAAVAAAAAASSNSMCSYTSPPHKEVAHARSPSKAQGSVSKGSNEERVWRTAVEGAVAAARALMHPKRLPQLMGLLPELLAPQRVAVALALLDSAFEIGEKEVTLGPSCELQHPRGGKSSVKSSNTVSSTVAGGAGNSNISQPSNPGVLQQAVPVMLSLLQAVPQAVLDAAAAAAADVASTPQSRQQLLHAVDTGLAMFTVDQVAKTCAAKRANQLEQQQLDVQGSAAAASGQSNIFARAGAAVTAAFEAAQMAVSHPATGVLGTPVVAAAAAAVAEAPAMRKKAKDMLQKVATPREAAAAAHAKLHTAATAASCVLGNPHSCVELETKAAGGKSSSGDHSVRTRGELLATLFGLHVSLAGDLWGLWWSYHTNIAVRKALVKV